MRFVFSGWDEMYVAASNFDQDIAFSEFFCVRGD